MTDLSLVTSFKYAAFHWLLLHIPHCICW